MENPRIRQKLKAYRARKKTASAKSGDMAGCEQTLGTNGREDETGDYGGNRKETESLFLNHVRRLAGFYDSPGPTADGGVAVAAFCTLIYHSLL